MAIVYTTTLPTNKPLNAYNNNVIEFYSNSASPASHAVITVGGIELEIKPDPSGNFYFNFKAVIKKLINSNYFKDSIEPSYLPNDSASARVTDSSLFLEVTTTIIVYLENQLKYVHPRQQVRFHL